MFPYTESYILSKKEASYFLSKVLWIGLQIYKILHGLTRKKQNKKRKYPQTYLFPFTQK